jgi:N-acetylglutamate synthase-like GNAT family acetyltransferase
MDAARFLVRRATVDDLPGLAILWARCGLQVLDLERHLTEFQLVSTWDGDLEAALALRVQGQEGLLHSEAFARPDEADDFRQLLWDRMKNLARNHNLVRLWTQEQGPFWHHVAGFDAAPRELLKRLPAAFGDAAHRWFLVSLHRDTPSGLSLEQEFDLFQQASRASLDRVLTQTRRIRVAGFLVAVILFLVVLGMGVYLVLNRARLREGTQRLRR